MTVERDLRPPTEQYLKGLAVCMLDEELLKLRDEVVIPRPVTGENNVGVVLGDQRADVLAVSASSIFAVEIKSSVDKIDRRFEGQAGAYGLVADYSIAVIDRRHLEKTAQIAPPFWGIVAADETTLTEIRKPTQSPDLEVSRLVRYLWADAARHAAHIAKCGQHPKQARRAASWQAILDNCTAEEIKALVRSFLINETSDGFLRILMESGIERIPVQAVAEPAPTPKTPKDQMSFWTE